LSKQAKISKKHVTSIKFNTQSKPKSKEILLIPKTINQEKYIIQLQSTDNDILVSHGPAGTGKTYLAMLAAIKAFKEGLYERIVLTRPAVGVEDEKHGFLPGSIEEKMAPWTRPLFDILREYYSPVAIQQMLEDQTIEISPLAFMRGRNFKNSFIVADEMQNSTKNQMLMLLTRIGEGSKIVVTGDLDQKDRKFQTNNGLDDFLNRYNPLSTSIAVCELMKKDIQRHVTVTEILNLYDKD